MICVYACMRVCVCFCVSVRARGRKFRYPDRTSRPGTLLASEKKRPKSGKLHYLMEMVRKSLQFISSKLYRNYEPCGTTLKMALNMTL
jgi:hypothetical protein